VGERVPGGGLFLREGLAGLGVAKDSRIDLCPAELPDPIPLPRAAGASSICLSIRRSIPASATESAVAGAEYFTAFCKATALVQPLKTHAKHNPNATTATIPITRDFIVLLLPRR
jgi:hypothetical protein